MFRPVILALFIFVYVDAYQSFRNKIPNGYYVPNPCSEVGSSWNGVGHRSAEGGGFLNSFGEDFRRNGKVWSVQLCEQDSDGDGLSNGQELGDPNCEWNEGESVQHDILGHPGICQPIGSDDCQHQVLSC